MLCTKERLFRWSSDGLCTVERRAVHHHIERGLGARKQEHLGYNSFGFFPLWGWRAQKKKKFVLLFFSSSEYRSQVWNIKLISLSTDAVWPDECLHHFRFLFQVSCICIFLNCHLHYSLLHLFVQPIASWRFIFEVHAIYWSHICWVYDWNGRFKKTPLIDNPLRALKLSSPKSTWKLLAWKSDCAAET